ncbi:MAG: hypothetical protein IKW74_07925, partial [Thermoguttaceae bacterium]|nr:hypothetical protein [Thermoguttaceae bacterium]
MDSRIQDLKKRLLTTPSFIRGIETLRDGKSILFDGLQGSSYALMGSAALDSLGGLLLVVTSRVGEVERVAADFTLFSEVEPETWPLLPEAVQEVSDDVFLSEDVCFGERLRCLKHLDQYCSGEKMRPAILVSSLAALLQPVPTRQQIQQETLFLKSGGEYDREQIIRWLIDGGFHGTSAVEFPGEFSVRGHILDIYAVDWKEPVRFEFFGDEIESIRRFDPVGQRSLESLEETELSRLRIQSRMDGTFIEHLPAGTTVLFLETDHIIHETQNLLNYQSKEVRKTNGSVADTVNALYHFPTIHAVSIASGNEFTTMTIPMAMQSVERFHGDVCDVEAVFDQTQSNEKIILVCANEAEIRRLEETFRGTRPAKENRLFFLTGCLSAGFNWLDSSTILLSTNQLFGRLGVRRPKKKKLGQVIDSFMDLSPGDLVIHVGHGLARFRGLKTITRAQQKEEHLELEFADNVVLYVPASKIGLVQRYVGTGRGNVSLAKINGTQWAKQKKMVQGAVFVLALEMLDIQAA